MSQLQLSKGRTFTVAAFKRQKDALERNWAKFETAVNDYDGMNSEDEDAAVWTAANDDYAQQAARFDTVIGDLETAIETKRKLQFKSQGI